MRSFLLTFGGAALLGTFAACDSQLDDAVVPGESATVTTAARSAPRNDKYNGVHQFTVQDINGQTVSLAQYRGRKLLIVNVASHCGYTPQYTQLEQLYQQYGNRVVVLGFPCNQFGGQEPGTDADIEQFCTGTYNVTFPLFHKIDVTGAGAIPLYQYLTHRNQNGVTNQAPTWNFCKYLVNEQGYVMNYWPSAVSPMSPQVINAILR